MSKLSGIPMVAINTTYKVGSKDEEEDKTGLAHFFEHLLFESSPYLKSGEFDEILNKNGGDSNAYTSWDSTSYYITIPSSKLELALWLESNRLFDFSIDEEDFEKQREVILEEKLEVNDNTPYGSLEEESSKRLFQNSGYRWSIIGNMKHIESVKLSDVIDFFNRYYIPNNAVLSIVGDIDYEETEFIVRKYYSGISKGAEIKRKDYHEEDIKEEITDDIYDDIHLPGKFLFYRIPEIGSKDYYTMQVLNGILSNGESSRFYKELVYRKELVNEIESNLYGMEKVSLFFINSIVLKDRSINDVGTEIDNVIDEVKSGNISDYEIRKIKNKIETGFSLRRQSIVSLADKFSNLKIFYNDCNKINNEVANYMKITKEDIVKAANLYLNNEQRVNLNYLPKKELYN
jgi:predicted Zn-dependent peptidase